MAAKAAQEKSTDVVRALSTEKLAELSSFDQAVALVNAELGSVLNASELLGDGFVVADKAALVGVPFIILDVKFAAGDYGQMVIARVMTQTNQKLVLVDGSTGVYAQLKAAADKNFSAGLFVLGGLTRSDYTYTHDNGEDTPAHTYYLAV